VSPFRSESKGCATRLREEAVSEHRTDVAPPTPLSHTALATTNADRPLCVRSVERRPSPTTGTSGGVRVDQPRLMSFADAVGEIAKATGREVRYVPVSLTWPRRWGSRVSARTAGSAGSTPKATPEQVRVGAGAAMADTDAFDAEAGGYGRVVHAGGVKGGRRCANWAASISVGMPRSWTATMIAWSAGSQSVTFDARVVASSFRRAPVVDGFDGVAAHDGDVVTSCGRPAKPSAAVRSCSRQVGGGARLVAGDAAPTRARRQALPHPSCHRRERDGGRRRIEAEGSPLLSPQGTMKSSPTRLIGSSARPASGQAAALNDWLGAALHAAA
jgi:hypothetical protein